METKQHHGGKLHPMHIAIVIAAILLGVVFAFNYSDTATAADGNARCKQKEKECNDKADNANPKKDKKKECKPKIDALPCQVSECIGKCKYGTGLCEANKASCPQGKSNTNPQKEKEEKPKEEKGGEGKPPEMPKPPEPKPKPPKEEKKKEECLASGKTQEECDKEKGILSKIPGFDRLKDFFSDPSGNEPPAEKETGETDAKKLLDAVQPSTEKQVGPDPASKSGPTPPPPNPSATKGTTASPPPKSKGAAGSSKGGGFPKSSAATTGFKQPQSQQAQLQSLWQRLLSLFR